LPGFTPSKFVKEGLIKMWRKLEPPNYENLSLKTGLLLEEMRHWEMHWNPVTFGNLANFNREMTRQRKL